MSRLRRVDCIYQPYNKHCSQRVETGCRIKHISPVIHLTTMTSSFVFLSLLTVATVLASAGADGDVAVDRQKKALVLGGNGFIGSEVVLRLVDEGYLVTTNNRGNWYWDNPVRVKTKVYRHFPCDRDDGHLKCWEFRDYVRNEVDLFDVVIDFTGYKASSMEDAFKALEGKVGLYIYISSDSVYMVSRRDQHLAGDSDGADKNNEQVKQQLDENRPWKEEDAIRPESATQRERFREEDPYGDDKLLCEESLIKQRKNGGFPYIALRLPDVLGQRDTTNRWWPYQLWLEFYHEIGVPFTFSDRMTHLRTSYVYVKDVVEGISSILRLNSSDIWDRAYNMGFDEGLTLEELIRTAQKVMGIEGVEYIRLGPEVDVEEAHGPIPGAVYHLPSVTYGQVDTSRAKKLLGWKPTPLEDALKEIIDYYKLAFGKQILQRDKALSSVYTYLIPEHRRASFRAYLERITKKAELEEELNKVKDEASATAGVKTEL